MSFEIFENKVQGLFNQKFIGSDTLISLIKDFKETLNSVKYKSHRLEVTYDPERLQYYYVLNTKLLTLKSSLKLNNNLVSYVFDKQDTIPELLGLPTRPAAPMIFNILDVPPGYYLEINKVDVNIWPITICRYVQINANHVARHGIAVNIFLDIYADDIVNRFVSIDEIIKLLDEHESHHIEYIADYSYGILKRANLYPQNYHFVWYDNFGYPSKWIDGSGNNAEKLTYICDGPRYSKIFDQEIDINVDHDGYLVGEYHINNMTGIIIPKSYLFRGVYEFFDPKWNSRKIWRFSDGLFVDRSDGEIRHFLIDGQPILFHMENHSYDDEIIFYLNDNIIQEIDWINYYEKLINEIQKIFLEIIQIKNIYNIIIEYQGIKEIAVFFEDHEKLPKLSNHLKRFLDFLNKL